MKIKPMLADWEIPRIAAIRTVERRAFVELAVPGRTGSLFQDLNTVPTGIVIEGSLYGDEARDEFLQELRGKFRDGSPVTFVADILTATDVQYVVIETLRVQESGASPDQLDYRVVLRESPPPPPPPDPLGGLDTSLLDQAAGLAETVTGAIDAIDALSNLPNFGNPAAPLSGAVATVAAATDGLDGIANDLSALFD
jgi:hypothetical protein